MYERHFLILNRTYTCSILADIKNGTGRVNQLEGSEGADDPNMVVLGDLQVIHVFK